MKLGLALIAIAVVAVGLARLAWGHGEAQWVADGNYTGANGGACCDERDCVVIYPLASPEWHTDGSVSYVIMVNGQPREMQTEQGGIHPSRTLDYWMCAWRGETTDELAEGRPRCFFWPGTASH